MPKNSQFQSAPSVRRATVDGDDKSGLTVFQSAPSVRRATKAAADEATKKAFQSAPSVRRATPRTRSQERPSRYFNPRPP